MNVAKQYDPTTTSIYYKHYQKMLSGKGELPFVTRALKVNDKIRLVLPLTSGNGRWATFYGLIHIDARVVYTDSGHLLYNVDNIRYECLDEFKEKFIKFREYGKSYWYDYRSTKELLFKEI